MNEIKLIVWDMDGTLLNDKKEFPKEFFYILKLLNKKGIKYGVASGRQYFRLKDQFKEEAENMFFIADNGTVNYYDKDYHYGHELDLNVALNIANLVNKIDGVGTIFCGGKSSYVLASNSKVIEKAIPYYKEIQVVENLDNINDKIYKLAIHDDIDSSRLVEVINKVDGLYTAVVSGKNWVDVAYPNVNKGSALKELLAYYGLSKDNCLAFGDFGNDLELLKEAKYSYAMLNATPEIKEASNYITKKDNNHNGVLDIIKDYFFRKAGFIFDMDGLMLDTESVGFQIWSNLLQKYGLEVKEEFLYKIRGRNVNSAKIIYDVYYPNSKVDFYELRERKNLLLQDYFTKNTIVKKKGIDNLLSYLKSNGKKLAVATSTKKDMATFNLKKTGLYDYFDAFVFGDQVEFSKPNPDIFLKATKALDLDVFDVMVLEDSMSGLMASKNAMIDSIWIPDGDVRPDGVLDYVYLEFKDLDEVVDYLKMLEE